MPPRHYGRVKLSVAVEVIVHDESGSTTLKAETVDVSACGARLEDMNGQLRAGQTVTVAYNGKQCTFRVIWVGEKGLPWAGQVGMECLEKNVSLWGIEFQDATAVSYDTLTLPWEFSKAS